MSTAPGFKPKNTEAKKRPQRRTHRRRSPPLTPRMPPAPPTWLSAMWRRPSSSRTRSTCTCGGWGLGGRKEERT